ncbi:MAG: D-2-hydroxyacid dehydrogenase [Firmicutes bacterium]|nr:D-2-hydroxyacid dehydrogenase [Bacillota bacterium]
MKIVILDGFTINPGDLSWSELEAIGQITVYPRTPQEEIITRIGDAEAIFTSKNKITAEVMEACPNLKFIGVLATGYDNVALAAAKARGIAVCNVPGYSTEPVAQHTFALILEISNQVGLHSQAVHDGQWCNSPDFCLVKKPLMQLSGKSLGIIGYGNIGKKVGEIAKAFGMAVNIYSRDPKAALASDIITLHCPATAENIGFVNSDFFCKLKDGAILINTARGALINESDLAAALKSGKLAAAALDVVDGEPMRADSPLLGAPNLFITPHIAWSTKNARAIICQVSADNVKSWLEGGHLNRID